MSTRLLVSTQELTRNLDNPNWVVIDVRHDLMKPDYGVKSYMEGHIPDAHFVSVDKDLAGAHTGTNGRHPLPDIDTFSRKMGRCGVTSERTVVAYDDMGGNWAVRLWWLLRWLGHEKVVLLDGDFRKWKKELRPMPKDPPPPRSGKFVPRPLLGATVDTPFVDYFRKRPDGALIDARAPDRFSGQTEPVDPVAGRVPGAINRFWQTNLEPDGTWKSPEQLRKEFEAIIGSTKPEQTVHMCGSGVTACHNIFAMELAGLGGSRLYPGSWSEWCSDKTRAVATGSYHR
ncbi:Putative thiosulfate sulfurtransferase SseB [Usitatibacter rugosus]|uniref:Thiosulfate sulfurtransferase SseB n=1 Tax=Usitatibacter rugosus TaxID=2732067 RepID=A0A6M4GZV1_9PROT|nr:sulfurtransferase [Usitatibacter rugosus]QJR12776.1 Putative thiosulfate sulfurtransferase SseB [Usitatibacter rugosus]